MPYMYKYYWVNILLALIFIFIGLYQLLNADIISGVANMLVAGFNFFLIIGCLLGEIVEELKNKNKEIAK